jgi:POT family proton-dependent oligopeptide transporter
MTLSLPAPEEEKKDSWTDSLHPETSWLDKRKTELGVEEKKTETKKPFFFEVKSSIGGGTELEGASYFRFFTMLMLITAFIFVPFAYFYKEKTYLQS